MLVFYRFIQSKEIRNSREADDIPTNVLKCYWFERFQLIFEEFWYWPWFKFPEEVSNSLGKQDYKLYLFISFQWFLGCIRLGLYTSKSNVM